MKSMEDVPFEVFRYGKVTAIDKKRCMARVLYEDRDDVVSDWLPVMQKNTLHSKFYWMPDINEIAVCLYLSNGQESGLIIGTIYAEDDDAIHKPVPEISDDDKERHGVWFEDGTFVKYEHDTQTLVINGAKNIVITASDTISINDKRGKLL